MASIFKRGGKKAKGYYYAAWRDHNGKRHTKCTKTTDKEAADRIANKYEADAALRRDGVIDTSVEHFSNQRRRPLGEHVDDFRAYLTARNNTDKHVRMTINQVREVIGKANARIVADLEGSSVTQAIDAIRRAGNLKIKDPKRRKPLSACTCNAYLRAIKSFTRWLHVTAKRMPSDALVGLPGYNEEADKRHERRSLTIAEIGFLLGFVEIHTRPEHNMAGPDRAMLYRVALSTGFRANELRSLNPESFEVTASTITVEAGHSKRRRRDTQPVSADFARLFSRWLADKPSKKRLFARMPLDTARMFRADLCAARAVWVGLAGSPEERQRREESDFLTYEDSAGGIADFHATRHTYITQLVAGGATVKTAQELARHSTCRLTIDRYAKTQLHDLKAAVDGLPTFAGNDLGPEIAQRQAQRAPGETVLFGADSCVTEIVEMAQQKSPAASETDATSEVVPLDAVRCVRGAGGSRTHDGGFAIRCLSLLATAP